jgi:small-conductance mechanosensitive channel
MNWNSAEWLETGERVLADGLALLLNPWTLLQLAALAISALLAWLLTKRLRPAIENRARNVKGNPDLLRLLIAFMQRLPWLFLAVLLAVARIVLALIAPSQQLWLLTTALTLAAAWFVISVLTRLIRSRALARVAAFGLWCYVALITLGIRDDIASVLDSAAINLGKVRISMLLALQVILLGIALFWLASFAARLFGRWIERSDELSPSFKYLISKLVKTALLIVAAVLALAASGIDLTVLAVFSGALGVGIGFGLQKVVSNFISGIIILLDKSIKPGDTITVGETFGWVRDLRARFVSVITRDGREYLIPNEEFITERVVNWSFSSEFVRLDVDFGVSYDSDPHQIVRIATDAAGTVERVSDHTKPVCWLTEFGDSSLNFRLRFWIADPRNGVTNVKGQVLMALWDAFKTAGISIPFPHREIILRQPVAVTPTGEQRD